MSDNAIQASDIDAASAFEAAVDEHAAVMADARRSLGPAMTAAFRALDGALAGGGRILVCGNGGSAADAQHFVAELVGRYERERPPLAAVALTTDTSILTAVANDFGYDAVFSRQVTALGRPGDALVAISTSGNSASVVRAAEAARAAQMTVVALTGAGGGRLATTCDALLAVPSRHVARIQEVHELCLHTLAELLEATARAPEATR